MFSPPNQRASAMQWSWQFPHQNGEQSVQGANQDKMYPGYGYGVYEEDDGSYSKLKIAGISFAVILVVAVLVTIPTVFFMVPEAKSMLFSKSSNVTRTPGRSSDRSRPYINATTEGQLDETNRIVNRTSREIVPNLPYPINRDDDPCQLETEDEMQEYLASYNFSSSFAADIPVESGKAELRTGCSKVSIKRIAHALQEGELREAEVNTLNSSLMKQIERLFPEEPRGRRIEDESCIVSSENHDSHPHQATSNAASTENTNTEHTTSQDMISEDANTDGPKTSDAAVEVSTVNDLNTQDSNCRTDIGAAIEELIASVNTMSLNASSQFDDDAQDDSKLHNHANYVVIVMYHSGDKPRFNSFSIGPDFAKYVTENENGQLVFFPNQFAIKNRDRATDVSETGEKKTITSEMVENEVDDSEMQTNASSEGSIEKLICGYDLSESSHASNSSCAKSDYESKLSELFSNSQPVAWILVEASECADGNQFRYLHSGPMQLSTAELVSLYIAEKINCVKIKNFVNIMAERIKHLTETQVQAKPTS